MVDAGRQLNLAEVTARELAKIFDAPRALTVGIEEEVMLLDPDTLDLTPRAAAALDRLGGDPRFKAELPASQLEIKTEPAANVDEALGALATGRRDLAAGLRGLARPAAAGVHPFAAAEGELAASKRFDELRERYGRIAHRQLVSGLQIHVAVGSAELTLPIYNALRGYLPEVAALAANAAFYEGADTGMASVRPLIAQLLPRQGMPPAIESWERFAGELRWGARVGATPEPRRWWWELRPHPGFGTLEIRVPDAQTTLEDAGAIVALVQALVAWLADRHDDASGLPVCPSWRIEENRWSAARYGTAGEMADLESGDMRPTRERLHALLDALASVATRLHSSSWLERARDLIEANGAVRQRRAAESGGVRRVASWHAEGFLR